MYPLAPQRIDLSALLIAQRARAADLVAYRQDLDGLRGVAVLSLLAVHCFPSWSTGGLIGVEIFFVLSGYLVTDGLLRAQRVGGFSFRDFYVGRARRILPALCLVLAACLVFGILFTSPGQAREIGGQVGWAAMFVSNVVAWKTASPFDLAVSSNPLLHLWALATIVQFYLIWPGVLAFVLQCQWSPLPLAGGLFAVSLAFNAGWVIDLPAASYYLPFGRLWQLMAGALLALWAQNRSDSPLRWLHANGMDSLPGHGAASHLLSWAGLLLLMLATLLAEHANLFPAWWALLPTLGTVSLLAAGPQGWVNRQVLASPILRFYGLISYPLVLWHWPLLCFPVVLGVPLTSEARVIILIASVVLAALTYELVEKPLRSLHPRGEAPRAFMVTLAAIGVFAWIVVYTDGLAATYPDSMRGAAPALQAPAVGHVR